MSDREFDIDTFSLMSVDEFMDYVSVAFKKWMDDNVKSLVDLENDTYADYKDAEFVFSSFLFMYPWVFDLFTRFLSDTESADGGFIMIHREVWSDRMTKKEPKDE